MKRTIQIHNVCCVSSSGVSYTTKIVDKDTGYVLSSCQTSFDSSNEAYAQVKEGYIKDSVEIYKEFTDVTEDECIEAIENLCYDSWIEKKLVRIDFEEIPV